MGMALHQNSESHGKKYHQLRLNEVRRSLGAVDACRRFCEEAADGLVNAMSVGANIASTSRAAIRQRQILMPSIFMVDVT